MTPDEQKLEYGKLVRRAKDAGLIGANYPDHNIVILRLPDPPKPEPTPEQTSPAPAAAASDV
jgi:hypothetical protein